MIHLSIIIKEVLHLYTRKEREMKRLCISLPDDLVKDLQKIKKKDIDKAYSEIIRELMAEAIKARNEKKAAG